MSLGAVWGFAIFVVTILSYWRGMGRTLVLLNGYFLGYSISYVGALVGLVWSFVYGFVGGVLIAWFYDIFCRMLYRTESPAK